MRKNRIVNRDLTKLEICGRVKVGEKDEKKGYPKSLDYFKPTGNFAAEFTKQYGDKPKKILIFFPNADALIQEYVLYVGTVRRGVSDGLTVDTKPDDEMQSIKFPNSEDAAIYMHKFADDMHKKYPSKHKGEWKLSCKMRFLLYELRGIMGLWEFSTKGEQSMVNQLANAFDNAIDLFGNISTVPFWLTVEKVKSNKNIFPVVSLNPAISFGQLIELKTGVNNIPELLDKTVKMLSAPQQPAIEAPLKKNLEVNSADWNKLVVNFSEKGATNELLTALKRTYEISEADVIEFIAQATDYNSQN